VKDRFGLSSQMAIRAIGKVVEPYRADRKPEKPHSFGLLGAMVYDQRNMNVSIEQVSLVTLEGRIRIPPCR
jgi:hypothetical protein